MRQQRRPSWSLLALSKVLSLASRLHRRPATLPSNVLPFGSRNGAALPSLSVLAAAVAAGRTPTRLRGTTVSHPVIEQAVESMNAVGGYEFASLTDIQAFCEAAPELFNSLATALAAIATNLQETPANVGVGEIYGQIAAGLSSLADSSGELAPTLRAGNAADFERIENPRVNEQMADYSVNAAG